MTVTLLTGCNLGDRERNMREVLPLIEERIGPIVKKSALYESEPYGFNSDDPFLNQALQCETELSPEALLGKIWIIENHFGKRRGTPAEELEKYRRRLNGTEGFTSRPMDIDILLYGDRIVETPLLAIPHREMHLRRFVLDPLCEIAGETLHPVLHKTIREIREELNDNSDKVMLSGC